MGVHGWDASKQKADEHAEGGTFLRLQDDGDKVVLAFLGEPFAREVVWGDKGPPEPFSKEHEAKGIKPRMLVSVNAYNKEQKVVQIFEQGVTWFRALLKVREKYGLDKWWFEMQRDGAAGSQKTTYAIFPEEKFTEQEVKDLAGLKLHDLENMPTKDDEEDKGKGKAKADDSTGAIDADVATDLVNQLKEMPRDALNSFLSKFDVKRIRDVARGDQKAAIQFVAELGGAKDKAAEEEGDVDPFA